MNSKKKTIIIITVILLLLLSILLVIFLNSNKDVINTEGIKIDYRIYTKKGYSKWFKNGQIAGTINDPILAIEAKIESDKKGNILYNIYSSNNNFGDNDSYNGDIAGDKEKPIYGIKMFLTDELNKNYVIYYRTHNKKDGWLEWTSDYYISGDNEVDIDQIQIKILNKNDKFDYDASKASIGF